MTTIEDISLLIDGRDYRDETTPDIEATAKAAGIVIAFGYSDDNVELRGAIYDEVGCYSGGTFFVTPKGLLQNDCAEGDDCPHFSTDNAFAISAVWGKDGCSWTYDTDIPHSKFFILEDGETYCQGIVFDLANLRPVGGTDDN